MLQFLDNDAAEMFIKDTLNIQDYAYREHPEVRLNQHQDNLEELGAIVAAHADIKALIARPTQYCKCPRKTPGWKRTAHYGWFVCPACFKPHKTVVANFIQNHLAGCNNLLPELLDELHPPEEHDDIPESDTSNPEHREVLVEATQETPATQEDLITLRTLAEVRADSEGM
jgi:hypothetical protein